MKDSPGLISGMDCLYKSAGYTMGLHKTFLIERMIEMRKELDTFGKSNVLMDYYRSLPEPLINLLFRDTLSLFDILVLKGLIKDNAGVWSEEETLNFAKRYVNYILALIENEEIDAYTTNAWSISYAEDLEGIAKTKRYI